MFPQITRKQPQMHILIFIYCTPNQELKEILSLVHSIKNPVIQYREYQFKGGNRYKRFLSLWGIIDHHYESEAAIYFKNILTSKGLLKLFDLTDDEFDDSTIARRPDM